MHQYIDLEANIDEQSQCRLYKFVGGFVCMFVCVVIFVSVLCYITLNSNT